METAIEFTALMPNKQKPAAATRPLILGGTISCQRGLQGSGREFLGPKGPHNHKDPSKHKHLISGLGTRMSDPCVYVVFWAPDSGCPGGNGGLEISVDLRCHRLSSHIEPGFAGEYRKPCRMPGASGI